MPQSSGDAWQPRARFTRRGRATAARMNLSQEDVDFILQHGRVVRRAGWEFYFLARPDIPERLRRMEWPGRLTGVTIMVAGSGKVAGLYRHARAWAKAKRRRKWRRGVMFTIPQQTVHSS